MPAANPIILRPFRGQKGVMEYKLRTLITAHAAGGGGGGGLGGYFLDKSSQVT